MPKNYDPKYDPDPERWLPRKERTGYRRTRKERRKGEKFTGAQGIVPNYFFFTLEWCLIFTIIFIYKYTLLFLFCGNLLFKHSAYFSDMWLRARPHTFENLLIKSGHAPKGLYSLLKSFYD